MRNEFTAIVEPDGPWYIEYCAEVLGANGQGKLREECLANLREAFTLILERRREETLRSLPPGTRHELVVVGGSARDFFYTSAGTAAFCGERGKNTHCGRTPIDT